MGIFDRQCSYQGIPEPTCANYGGDGTPIGAPLFGVQIKNSTNDLQIDCRYNDNTNCSGGHTFDSGYDITSKPAILTLQRTYGQSIKLFYDGKEVSSKSDVAKLLKIQPLKIGRHVNWETFGTTQSLDTYISEIIFITDKITDKDRDDIENYLGKKYAIGVSH